MSTVNAPGETGLPNIFPVRLFTQMSFFSTSYLLGSIQVVIPLAVVFIFFALATVALIAIVIYNRFFLHRRELYGDVKDFFKERINYVTKSASASKKQKKKQGAGPGSHTGTPQSTPQALTTSSSSPVMSRPEQSSGVLPPEEADEDDTDDLLTDLDMVVEEVMHKNKWCLAFENILAHNNDNARNMRALHSILTIPLDFRMTSSSENAEMSKDSARVAVAIRRRQRLAESGVLPFVTGPNSFRDNALTSQTVARAITQRLEEMGRANNRTQGAKRNQMLSETQPRRLDSRHFNDLSTGIDSLEDSENYQTTMMENFGGGDGRRPVGALDSLVNALMNPSIADPHYMADSRHWKMD